MRLITIILSLFRQVLRESKLPMGLSLVDGNRAMMPVDDVTENSQSLALN